MYAFSTMRAQLLSRPTDEGVGRHYGIALWSWDGSARVIEKQRTGIEANPYCEFFRLGDVRIEGSIDDPSELRRLEDRLARAAAWWRPWNLFSSNCEHFARQLFEGGAVSYQVRTGVLLACIAGLIWAGSREG